MGAASSSPPHVAADVSASSAPTANPTATEVLRADTDAADAARDEARQVELDALRSKHKHQMAVIPAHWTIDQKKFLTTLIWAPLFPIIRMTTNRLSKRAQPWFMGFAIVVANLHGFWLIQNPDLSDVEFAKPGDIARRGQ